MASAN